MVVRKGSAINKKPPYFVMHPTLQGKQVTASARTTEETECVTSDVSQNAADLKTEAEKLAQEAGRFVIC